VTWSSFRHLNLHGSQSFWSNFFIWSFGIRISYTVIKHVSHLNSCKSPHVVWWLLCLTLRPMFGDSNPAEENGFLRAIKTRGTTSFRGEGGK
jgi:hypothetical protein